MDNVSKALTIAGGVLIAILVVTLLVLGLSRLRHYQNVEIAAKKNEQISEFNSQFESYNKQVITGYELISVGHMTEDSNDRYPVEQGYVPVNVYVKPLSYNASDSSLGAYLSQTIAPTKIENKYYDLVDFTRYFDGLSDYNQKDYNQKRKLKEAYFKCEQIKYDDRVDKSKGLTASGRVIEMRFAEMKKLNN